MLPQIDNLYKSHPFVRPDIVKDKLYVICPIFNPIRYRSRWKLYLDFERYLLSYKEVHLVTIECSFGQREEVIVEKPENHTVIHVYTTHELWLKENLINLAIQRLPKEAKYIAWIDGDIKFSRGDWCGETIQQLQHYDVVQMFSQSVDLGPNYEILKTHRSFAWCFRHEGECCWDKSYSGRGSLYKHPGFCWAMKRQAFDHLGGLMDWAILGGADMFMAYALINKLDDKVMPRSLGKTGIKWMKQWQDRANQHIKGNLGYVDGLILHYWHGSKANRKYNDRGQILTKASFDPEKDIKKDWQGLLQLSGNNQLLRDGIREYFRNREEDSITI